MELADQGQHVREHGLVTIVRGDDDRTRGWCWAFSAKIGRDVAKGHDAVVVFVEVPQAGRTVAKGESVAVVESVKAASDIYSPASGDVTEANAALADSPGDVNADPMGKGWFYKLRLANKAELDSLMDQAAYDSFVKGLG